MAAPFFQRSRRLPGRQRGSRFPPGGNRPKPGSFLLYYHNRPFFSMIIMSSVRTAGSLPRRAEA